MLAPVVLVLALAVAGSALLYVAAIVTVPSGGRAVSVVLLALAGRVNRDEETILRVALYVAEPLVFVILGLGLNILGAAALLRALDTARRRLAHGREPGGSG